MNRRIKSLSIISAISGVIAIVFIVFVFLRNNFSIFQAIKSNFEILFINLIVDFCLIREIKISKSPLKEVIAEVVDLQIKWEPLTRQNDLLATFKTADEQYWTFDVVSEIYNKLIIGEQGKLAYREKNQKVYFVFFTSLDTCDENN